MANKIVAIIQARMGSTRLPGKVLLPLSGKPVLQWMVDRISLANKVDEIVIATSTDPGDIEIARNPNLTGAKIYRGSEDDVMRRVLDTSYHHQADIIVDVTADCPLIDPKHIDLLIKEVESGRYHYASNISPRTWPDGFDVQVYRRQVLGEVRDIFAPPHHVGWNIAQHPEMFRICNLPATGKYIWPSLGLTLDTPEDYTLLKSVFAVFGDQPGFTAEDVITFMRENPCMAQLNKDVKRKAPEEG